MKGTEATGSVAEEQIVIIRGRCEMALDASEIVNTDIVFAAVVAVTPVLTSGLHCDRGDRQMIRLLLFSAIFTFFVDASKFSFSSRK
jgi:hypothetical protein